MSIVKSKKKTKAEINEVIEFVRASGGPEYAENKRINTVIRRWQYSILTRNQISGIH